MLLSEEEIQKSYKNILKKFKEDHNTRKLSFVSENDLMKVLNLIPGSVSPFGLLNDKECKDPDEYILKNGPERFKKCMDDALSVVEYKIKVQ